MSNRAYVECKRCGKVAYYDYEPYSLSNPIMIMPCAHNVAERWVDAVRYIDEATFNSKVEQTKAWD